MRPRFAYDHDNTTLLDSPPAHEEGGGAPKGASIHWPRQAGRRCRLSPVVAARATQTNVATRLRFGRARLSALRRGSRQRLSPGWLNSRPCFLGRGEACDPEKWKPVFRKDHTQLKASGRYASRWSLLKSGFSRGLAPAKRSMSKIRKREKGIWQRRYWEHAIRNDVDFERHVDYIHYNPVKHGLVTRVADWPFSSFHRYVAQGILPGDWGGDARLSGRFGE